MTLRPRSARVLLLGVNSSLAVGIPCCALAFFLARRPDATPRIAARAPERPPIVTVSGDDLGRLFGGIEARRLLVLPVAPPARPPEQPPRPDADGDTGPLAGAWRYVFFILRQDPNEDVVALERTDGGANPPMQPRVNRQKPVPQRVTLHPGQGPIDGARLGLDREIQVVEANRDEILYRVSGEAAGEPYRLGYRARSRYAGTGVLGPAP